jgi:hypothetical protein
MDSATVDTRRRLVLVRRDNVEHLILIGGPSDVVVEQNIVRNAPLPTHRSIPVAAQTGSASIKAPLAPGPDIPLRPGEGMADAEPVTPPAPVATPVEPSAPESTPSPAPIIEELPSSAEKEPAAPSVASLPRSKSSFEKREPSLSLGTDKTEKKDESSGGNGRAAELLRAAMQNGFNRATTKSAEGEAATDKKIDKAVPAEERSTAPDVKPALASTSSAADVTVKPETNPSAPVKPIARPFSPKDRPSYGGHSISPPASGPAARAKTALFKTASSSASENKIEPLVDEPASAASQGPEGDNISAAPSSDFSVKAPDIKSPAPNEPAPEPETSEAAQNAEDPPATSSGSAARPAAPSTGDTAQTLQQDKSVDPKTESISKSPETSAPEVKLDLGLGDLIEETDETTQKTASDEDKGSRTEDKEAEASQSQKQQQQQTKAAAPAAKSLSEKNPIEDEMAKLLDELGGQPN